MAKRFIQLNQTTEHIDEVTIEYMINPGLSVNKTFREQVEEFMYTTFCEITQPFIKTTFSKNNTRVLALIMFHEIG